MRALVLIAVALLVVACERSAPAPAPREAVLPAVPPVPWLIDDTAASGIDLVTTSGREPVEQIVQVKAGGLAVVDLDGDDDLDVFVPNGATLDAPARGPGARLYRNRGNGAFDDVTRESGITFRGWGMGVAAGDVDGDGDVDLYVAAYGDDVLLRNAGDGTFTEEPTGVDGWSTGVALGDLDGDGDLDAYVARYLEHDIAHPAPRSTFRGVPVIAGPRGLPPTPDVVLANDGQGRFTDVTHAWGFDAVEPSYGLGAVIFDFDGDGAAECFVGNDSRPNFLFAREPGAAVRFVDRGVASGLATAGDGSSRATMGIAIGDVDEDGRPDVWTTNFAGESNTLHAGRDGGFFDDVTARFGLAMPGRRLVGWGSAFGDLDEDGDEDLVVVNGHVYPEATATTMFSAYRQRPILLERDGARFVEVEPVNDGDWLAAAACARSIVLGDLDGDGDLDAVIAGVNEPVRVLRNEAARRRWLIVAPERPLGCRIEVRAPDHTFTRWIAGGAGFMSAGPLRAHVGLGATRAPYTVVVRWPDGHERTITGVKANGLLRVPR